MSQFHFCVYGIIFEIWWWNKLLAVGHMAIMLCIITQCKITHNHNHAQYHNNWLWLVLFLQTLIKFKSHLYFEEKDEASAIEKTLKPKEKTKVSFKKLSIASYQNPLDKLYSTMVIMVCGLLNASLFLMHWCPLLTFNYSNIFLFSSLMFFFLIDHILQEWCKSRSSFWRFVWWNLLSSYITIQRMHSKYIFLVKTTYFSLLFRWYCSTVGVRPLHDSIAAFCAILVQVLPTQDVKSSHPSVFCFNIFSLSCFLFIVAILLFSVSTCCLPSLQDGMPTSIYLDLVLGVTV